MIGSIAGAGGFGEAGSPPRIGDLVCPSMPPTDGGPCQTTETCRYQASSTCPLTSAIARCEAGAWIVEKIAVGCNPPPKPIDEDAGI